MSKEQLYFKILQDVAARIRRAVENYEVDKDPERMKQELISILEGRGKKMADSPGVMVEYYESLKRDEVEAINKTALVEWITESMDAMGTPPAYSYRVGIYHGMEKVLKQVEAGKFDVRGEEG